MRKMPTDLLNDVRILVTRPAHQADVFCHLLEEQGGQAIRLPVIEIEAMALSQKMSAVIDNIDDIDFAIFISPNAVEYGLSVLFDHGKIPDKLKLVTIGQASAQKMQQLLGRMPTIYPTEHYNSEALLALESLQCDKVNHKKILIFRGRGGREFLAEKLRQRGAWVEYAEVYARKKPSPENSMLESIWHHDTSPDIVTVTSNEGLCNLLAMFERANEQYDSCLEKLLQTPLVVVTEKMRISAQKSGFKNVIIIHARSSNEALLESVLEWSRIRKH